MVSSMLIVLERSSEAMGEVVVYRYVVIIMTISQCQHWILLIVPLCQALISSEAYSLV
jgi:hypothetical protein